MIPHEAYGDGARSRGPSGAGRCQASLDLVLARARARIVCPGTIHPREPVFALNLGFNKVGGFELGTEGAVGLPLTFSTVSTPVLHEPKHRGAF